MENLLPLLIGWLLGTLSPGIAERIRRKHTQRDLIRSVLAELADLQYIMALAAYSLRTRQAQTTDAFLDWLIPIVQAYDGPNTDPEFAAGIAKLRKLPEAQRREAALKKWNDSATPDLPQYGLPFLANQLSQFSICPLDFQRRVFWIKGRLEIINHQIGFVRSQYDKTFDTTMVDASRNALQENLRNGYRNLATQAELIVRSIGEILSKYQAYRRAA